LGFLRIIAGELGGRRIRTPPGRRVRPTADRVREALFSILGSSVEGARVLDAFAGTGALGLEALSRGAHAAVFVESSTATLRVLRGNVESLGLMERCRIVRADAVTALERCLVEPAFDLVLADPPYDSPLADRFVETLASGAWLSPGGLLVVERRVGATPSAGGPGLTLGRSSRYGDTRLDFYSP